MKEKRTISVDPTENVGAVAHRSRAARSVMAELGIDPCCGAHLTLAEAAAAAGVPLDALRARLDAALGAVRPVRLDVRDDLRRGEHPLAKIMAAANALGENEALVVRAPFEPVPLYEILGRRGFAHWTERAADDDWSVGFYRAEVAPRATPAKPADAVRIVDVRGLAPPEPMVRVLERLDTLGPAETLVVLHDRRPTLLYPQLEERGFAHATDEPTPDVVRIRIRRATSTGGEAFA